MSQSVWGRAQSTTTSQHGPNQSAIRQAMPLPPCYNLPGSPFGDATAGERTDPAGDIGDTGDLSADEEVCTCSGWGGVEVANHHSRSVKNKSVRLAVMTRG